MKKTILGAIVALSALLASQNIQAQNNNLYFGGLVLNHDIMMSTDFAALSQTQNFGTSRVMGMGGAFTSLGADLSSMNINPAGLGMYRSDEVSITPILMLNSASTEGTQTWQDNNKNRFTVANFGAVYNIYESARTSLISISMGFGMNRIADFNSRTSYSYDERYAGSPVPAVAEVYGQMLGQSGIFPATASDGGLNGSLGYNNNPYFWPAILGYNGFQISTVSDGQGGKMWVPDMLGDNASILRSVDVLNSGSINEFTASFGANFDNILYLGATFGLQTVYKSAETLYQEEYGYFNASGARVPAMYDDGTELSHQLDYSTLYQKSITEGSGVNLKLGAIVRPIESLRIGVAFHTPTYYSLSRSYGADIQTQFYNNINQETTINRDVTPLQIDEFENGWSFTSPPRLLTGISYTFGQFAILSLDYQRDWYNAIRVKGTPPGVDFSEQEYKEQFKGDYKATNTVRFGVEIRPLPIVALRFGAGHTDSMFKDTSLYYDTPSITETTYYTAGAGVHLSDNIVLDVAYQNVQNKYTEYQLFYSQYGDGQFLTNSGSYESELSRHFISMTLGIHF